MNKFKKVSLLVFAIVIVGLIAALFVEVHALKERYALLEKTNRIRLLAQGINFDKDGFMWVASNEYVRAYKDGNLAKEYLREGFDFVFDKGEIIAFDEKGRVWTATLKDVFVLENGSFNSIYSDSDRYSRNGEIWALDIDRNGDAWIGFYNGGIKVIDITGKVIKVYNKSNSGLGNDTLLDIAFDNNGLAWIATSRAWTGIQTFDGSEWKTYDPGGGGKLHSIVITVYGWGPSLGKYL